MIAPTTHTTDGSRMAFSRIYFLETSSGPLQVLMPQLTLRGYNCLALPMSPGWQSYIATNEASCLVVDARSLPNSPKEFFQLVHHAVPTAAVVVIADSLSVEAAVEFMEQGAATVLLRPVEPKRLTRGVERALVLARFHVGKSAELSGFGHAWSKLTKNEQHVVQWIVEGRTTQSIALRFNVSTRTVDRRRSEIFAKLGVTTAPELALLLGMHRQELKHRREML